ncbi:MAG: trypsin-like peptidase domain-containing protein [Verrucomicrobia bacterium]|nr:trypsin-like peptidase domain-containing protein [Verrucomicrobiota bacterium]
MVFGHWSFSAETAPPRFVVDDEAFEDTVIASAQKLMKQGKLVRADVLQKQLSRIFSPVKFAPPSSQKLAPPELYDRVRESTLAIGTVYECTNCSDWHFNSAAGFVLTEDGVVSTAYHVANGKDEEANPKTGSFLVAANSTGKVFPVKEILAADVESDTCLLRIEATGFKPLALRTGARTGERVFCLSHPDGNHFLFSEGMVARVHLMHDVLGADGADDKPERASRPILCLNITADFAPGSSGGPVVDEAGNVVALVQSIANFVDDDGKGASPLVVGPVRYCVSAEEIVRLTQPHDPPAKKRRTKKK